MSNDMVVSLGESGRPLLGVNIQGLGAKPLRLGVLHQVRPHYEDENSELSGILSLPRPTFRVLALQEPEDWGVLAGVNEHGVGGSFATWTSRIPARQGSLAPGFLTRIVLQRSKSALQAVEMLTHLVDRYGLGGDGGGTFTIADRKEAFVLEVASRAWALSECRGVRVATGAPMLRQDWDRLSQGLSEWAIESGAWEDTGGKLDFTHCFDSKCTTHALARKRWGNLALDIGDQYPRIDDDVLRRQLFAHYWQHRELHAPSVNLHATVVLPLAGEGSAEPAWVSFQPTTAPLFFPVWPGADVPNSFWSFHPEAPSLSIRLQALGELALTRPSKRVAVEGVLQKLAARFEEDALALQREVGRVGGSLARWGLLGRASEIMHQHASLFEQEASSLLGESPRARTAVEDRMADSVIYFA